MDGALDVSFVGDPEDNVWNEITSEILGKTTDKLPPSKVLLILGDEGVDRNSLVGRLQGKTLSSIGRGMEYSFVNVRDEYCEDQTKLNIWSLDEDAIQCNLLKFVLNRDTFADTTVLLLVSMVKPWEIMDRLETWASVLEKHVADLGFPSTEWDSFLTTLVRRFREYVEPGFHVPCVENGEGVRQGNELRNNFGLDVIVVVDRTESMKALVTDMGYENEHFDFIQLHLRQFCLSYGAALIYLSVKEDRNCDLLLRYIMHRVYAFSSRTPALFTERDCVFVPSGWDSTRKIEILSNTLLTIDPSAPYHLIISRPSRIFGSQVTQDAMPLSDQEFLSRLEATLGQPLTEGHPEASLDIPRSSPAMVQRSGTRRVNRSPVKKLEPRSQSAEGDTVLHTFFQSLLNRKTSMPAHKSSTEPTEDSAKEQEEEEDVFARDHTPLHRERSMPTDFPMTDDIGDCCLHHDDPLDEGVPFRRSLPVGVRDFSRGSDSGRLRLGSLNQACCPTGSLEPRISDLVMGKHLRECGVPNGRHRSGSEGGPENGVKGNERLIRESSLPSANHDP